MLHDDLASPVCSRATSCAQPVCIAAASSAHRLLHWTRTRLRACPSALIRPTSHAGHRRTAATNSKHSPGSSQRVHAAHRLRWELQYSAQHHPGVLTLLVPLSQREITTPRPTPTLPLPRFHRPSGSIPTGASATTQVGNPAELRNIMAALGPRDDAIRRGMTLQGQRYEVRTQLCFPTYPDWTRWWCSV